MLDPHPGPRIEYGQALSQDGRGGRRTRRGVCRRVMGRFGVCTCQWSFFGGRGVPSLCLSPGGGEIGTRSVFFSGRGEIGVYVFALTVLLFLGERGKDWRLGEASELFQVLEVLEDGFQEISVVLGSGVGLLVVVTMVVGGAAVAWCAAAATGGAVFFGHVCSEEHHQEGRRGVGLLSALEEHDFEHVGVPEDG